MIGVVIGNSIPSKPNISSSLLFFPNSLTEIGDKLSFPVEVLEKEILFIYIF